MKKPHIFFHFAHRKEAQSFLKEWSLKSVEEGLYFGEGEHFQRSLLISGEGIHKTTLNLTRAIALSEGVSAVFHMGVCGHIPRPGEDFPLGQAVCLRSCIHKNESLDFKTFSCEKSHTDLPVLDIITLEQRVLNIDEHEKLSAFASLVDREAWAAAQVANFYEIPFYGIKVISDFADGEFCQSVKDDAAIWSDTLYRSFESWEMSQQNKAPFKHEEKGKELDLQNNFKELHITVSQERTLKNLISALMLKGHDLESIKKDCDFESILEVPGHAKNKTKLFITRMQELLNPLEKEIKEKLLKQTQYLEKAGFNIRFDQGLEQDLLHLQITLDKKDGFKRAARALEQYNFEEFQRILRAQDDHRGSLV